MARIVNVSKVLVARTRSDPNGLTKGDLITDIQGNAALTDDLTSTVQHTGSGGGCPIGLPYQGFGFGEGSASVSSQGVLCATMVEVPAGETEIDVALVCSPSDILTAEVRDAAWVRLDKADMISDGENRRVRLTTTSGNRTIVIRADPGEVRGRALRTLSISFPGNSEPSRSMGSDDTVTVPAAFVDIDDVFVAADQGWSGFHATTIDQNMNYLEEFISGGPCFPNGTPVLSAFYVGAPETVPIMAQCFGWMNDDQSAPSLGWDAPGCQVAAAGYDNITTHLVRCSQATNLKVRVLISTADKTFGTTTVATVRVRAFDTGMSIIGTTVAGAWTQVGSQDLYWCEVAVGSNTVSEDNALFVDFAVPTLAAGNDNLRILSVSAHHAN